MKAGHSFCTGSTCKACKHERKKWPPRWSKKVVDLLHRRPDLRGSARVAEVVDEAVRWSA